MLVLEYKIKAKKFQYLAIESAIKTPKFIRNKCLRSWIDAPKGAKIDRFALNKYSTELDNEFNFVANLNSMALQASAKRAWLAISRFYDNCQRADGYYYQFCLDVEVSDIQPSTGNEIGLESFYADSHGHQEANPNLGTS